MVYYKIYKSIPPGYVDKKKITGRQYVISNIYDLIKYELFFFYLLL